MLIPEMMPDGVTHVAGAETHSGLAGSFEK
jgi:hypothetical protein